MSVSVDQIRRDFNAKAFGKTVMSGKFFNHAVKNDTLSAEVGYPVYTSKVFIKIKTQGRRDTTSRVATDADKEIFQEAWEEFRKLQDEGMLAPLQILPGFSDTNAAVLNELGIKSAEELAAYTGDLYTYEQHVMRHAAQAMEAFWETYQPPEKSDVRIPENDNRNRPGNGQALRASASFSNPSRPPSAERDRPAGERLGVYLNERGEIEAIEGHGTGGPDFQEKESQQQEEKIPPEVTYTYHESGTQFEPPENPLEGLVG